MQHYRAPRWLPGGNLQTLWPALLSRQPPLREPSYRRERWATPDGDFIDVDIAEARADAPCEARADAPCDTPAGHTTAPMLVMFHGLEGSSRSHYAQAFARHAAALGWSFVVPHFRGCSGELNLAPRAYHSGDHEEIGWILARLRARHGAPLLAVGVSLGGNALLRWAEEAGAAAAATVSALAAVSSPIDLAAGGHAIGRGFNRQVYTRMFLRTMKAKALLKWQQHPGLFDRDKLRAARTLYEFDNLFTAPLHGFRDTDDYWLRASAKPHLRRIQIPTLVLNARNDPFVPGSSLPGTQEVGAYVTLWQPQHGGHVGFPTGRFPGHLGSLPGAVNHWLLAHSV
jgi:predicted alpha/beta-fold hydrolase